MSSEIIAVENISKMYRLGEIHSATLSEDVLRLWARIRGKEDPYQVQASANYREQGNTKGYVWSLRDISFEVNQGEVFGIIGKNGAGKSTLLKLLSKITKPTRGIIRIDGRVASLLEVGTGFHPDLSGRENVYLNGAILGMKKREIRRKFDEIVNFSGIERYIDTPVKRYSSGMFVRLAFAVAAHLEPEILIIDEVLAVGDAEFQQKCLGKMKEVSTSQGRTILFVSHNAQAVRSLCNRAMLLENGSARYLGSVERALEEYQDFQADDQQGVRVSFPENQAGYFLSWHLQGQSGTGLHSCFSRETCRFVFRFKALREIINCVFHMALHTDTDTILTHVNSQNFSGSEFVLSPGDYLLSMEMELPVNQGNYQVEAGLFSRGNWIDRWKSSTRLSVLNTFEVQRFDGYIGIFQPRTHFHFEPAEENRFVLF